MNQEADFDFSRQVRSFSQRKGLKAVCDVLQTDEMSKELRNSIWSVLVILIFRPFENESRKFNDKDIVSYFDYLNFNLFKVPVEHGFLWGTDDCSRVMQLRDRYGKMEWHGVYDFLEATLSYFESHLLMNSLNQVLQRELSGYRFIGAQATEITSEQEIEMLQEALDDSAFQVISSHLRNALSLMSSRDNPDYRNSIKESISAVESLAKLITGQEKSTLGTALKELEKTKIIHPSLKDSFLKLYGYTSDEGGIRHGMLEEPDLTADDAKYILLSCTSFINYLKSKIS
jgi:hypothetical protein